MFTRKTSSAAERDERALRAMLAAAAEHVDPADALDIILARIQGRPRWHARLGARIRDLFARR